MRHIPPEPPRRQNLKDKQQKSLQKRHISPFPSPELSQPTVKLSQEPQEESRMRLGSGPFFTQNSVLTDQIRELHEKRFEEGLGDVVPEGRAEKRGPEILHPRVALSPEALLQEDQILDLELG